MVKEIILPEGWEVDKIENGKIILKEVEPKYPRTWEECMQRTTAGEYIDRDSIIPKMPRLRFQIPCRTDISTVPLEYGKKVLALCQLLICRNAYWKDWKPNWRDLREKYCILQVAGVVCRYTDRSYHHILSFPTEEMRDAFYENFKDLIEKANDLL